MRNVSFEMGEIGFPGGLALRDIWAGKDLGRMTGVFTAALPKHGVMLLVGTKVRVVAGKRKTRDDTERQEPGTGNPQGETQSTGRTIKKANAKTPGPGLGRLLRWDDDCVLVGAPCGASGR